VPIKNRQQFLTIITLSAVGLLALDRIVRPPLQKIWDDRSLRIEKLHQQVKDGQLLLQRKNWLKGHWEGIQKSTLPNDPTAAEQLLFSGLNDWVQNSDVALQGVSPTWKQGNDPAYKTLECRVDVSGRIDQLSQFLYYMETNQMALRVQSIEMTSKDANGSNIGLGVNVSALVLATADVKK
jgi:hypothetical protein